MKGIKKAAELLSWTALECFSDLGWNRTSDRLLRRQLLYPLSYEAS